LTYSTFVFIVFLLFIFSPNLLMIKLTINSPTRKRGDVVDKEVIIKAEISYLDRARSGLYRETTAEQTVLEDILAKCDPTYASYAYISRFDNKTIVVISWYCDARTNITFMCQIDEYLDEIVVNDLPKFRGMKVYIGRLPSSSF